MACCLFFSSFVPSRFVSHSLSLSLFGVLFADRRESEFFAWRNVVYRFALAIYFSEQATATFQEAIRHGLHPSESWFSAKVAPQRKRRHCRALPSAASWLVIGFGLPTPLRRPLDAHLRRRCAGDIGISLWRAPLASRVLSKGSKTNTSDVTCRVECWRTFQVKQTELYRSMDNG